jgi:hypothetical protein
LPPTIFDTTYPPSCESLACSNPTIPSTHRFMAWPPSACRLG